MSSQSSGEYVLGHSERELERLERQAVFFADMTREVLERAGVRTGMKVLDLGCGVGDVSLIAAELVGEDGQVTGIDISEGAVALARARAESAGAGNAEFAVSAIEDYDGFEDFDAVVGRFILIHMADAAGSVADIGRRVKPGTVIAFGELDLSTAAAIGDVPLLSRYIGYVAQVYKLAGFEPDMGTRLYATLRGAGLEPELFGFTRVATRRDTDGFAYLTESIRSLMPTLEKVGLATAADIGIDTLYDRLVAETAEADACTFYPRFTGAWARA